jgi:ribosomal protein S18 acetylase RimI-like enzyme
VLSFATAEDTSLETFLAVSEGSPHQGELREYVESLLRQRCTKPAWCLVGHENDRPVARASLWALPGQPVPTDVVLIDADWNEPDLARGKALLTQLHELAAGFGAEAVGHSVDSPPGPPQYQGNEEARIRLLAESGYALLRDGLRWLQRGRVERHTSALVFRALPDVGEEAFVAALASTYEGTRDSWINRTIAEHGLLGAARSDFLELQGMEYRPEWWELAYTEDGALAGVVMAARNPSSAVIAYVGVVPEQRGKGLAVELVRRGTEQLVASGAEEIRGDCDRDNVGMVKAFERAGYERIARRRTYQRAVE